MKKLTFDPTELTGASFNGTEFSIAVTKNEDGSFTYYFNGIERGVIAKKDVPAFAAVMALSSAGLLSDEQRKIALNGERWKLISDSSSDKET
jgi:hypothetical protein